jgi:hypothetical protein
MIDAPTKKDQIFAEAKKDFGVQMDRRMTCAELSDQLQRMKDSGVEKDTSHAPAQIPKRVRNVMTGNEFDYDPVWAKHPDLLIIEWESADGNN